MNGCGKPGHRIAAQHFQQAIAGTHIGLLLAVFLVDVVCFVVFGLSATAVDAFLPKKAMGFTLLLLPVRHTTGL